MSKSKIGPRITMSVSEDLLELADLQAELMHLDRYDVLRMAIAQGLLVLRMQHEVMSDPETYKHELLGLVSGDGSAAASIGRKLESRLPASVERQVKKRRSGAA